MVTLRGKLARRKGTFVKKNRFRAKVTRGTRRARTPQEGNMARKDPGGRWPRYLMEERILTTNGIGAWTTGQQLLLGRRGLQKGARYELVSVDIATAMMWSIKDWTLWRCRPPPKRLKRESEA
jgi:hypothetical protein